MLKKLFNSRFLILFVVASGFAFYRFVYRKPPNEIKLAALPIKTLDGSVFNSDTFEGKTVFLTFWATWCGDCRREMPGLQRAISQMKNENIAFVLVSDEDETTIEEFITKFGYVPTNFFRLTESYRKQGIKAIPTNYIISPTGKVLLLETESGRDWSAPENIQLLKDLLSRP